MPTQTLTGQTVLVLNPAKVHEFLNGPTGPVVRDLFTRGERVRQRAIQLSPIKSGNLRDHHVKRLSTLNGRPAMLVGVVGVPYALFVHEGTQPHDILPKAGKYLVFVGRTGDVVFARSVHHPGTRPRRWLIQALAAAQ